MRRANQLRKHLRSLREKSPATFAAPRDAQSAASPMDGHPPSPRECLCKTVADDATLARDESAMEPLDASKTSVTHRGRCALLAQGAAGCSFGGAFVGEKRREIEMRTWNVQNRNREAAATKGRYVILRGEISLFEGLDGVALNERDT